MNLKRLLLAVVGAFVFLWLTDFLIHGVWLKNDYAASMSLWRSEADMKDHFVWLMLGELLATFTFTVLYAKGFAAKACPMIAMMFGLFMAGFSQSNTLITYAVQPIPGSLAVKWFFSAVAQGMLLGLILFFLYKPKPDDNSSGDCAPGK